MKKLYYEDAYIKNFTAEVLEIIEKGNEFHVVLDQTTFYPGGGGQPCDTGLIETFPVTSVYEENDKIYHIIHKKLIKIHKVKCSIDWESRFDAMQQHLGQHILSACFLACCDAKTSSFHLGKDHCTIDIDIPLNQNQLQEVEKMANQVIFNRLPVEILYPSKAELKKLSLKDLPKGKGAIRIVRIPDLDVNPCGGVHPSTTIEVQGIKITRIEKNRQNTRVEFLAGSRIMSDYLNKASFSNTICQTLNCNEQSALQKIDSVVQELKQLTSLTTKLHQEVLDYQVQDYLDNAPLCKHVRIVNLVFENQDVKQISTLATKLTSFDDVVAILATTQEDSANLIFKCSSNLKKLNMSNLLKDSISLINGRGGGSATSAQGGGKNNNNLTSALEYACNQIQKSI